MADKKATLLELNIRDLKCDACGHYDVMAREQYASMVGHPCPKCGANMLTQADYNMVLRFEKIVSWLNRWFGWLSYIPGLNKKRFHQRFEANGTGKLFLVKDVK